MVTENEQRLAKACAEKIQFLENQISKLNRRVELAENCIFAVEDALDRGDDNSWAREVIDRWERANEFLEEYHK